MSFSDKKDDQGTALFDSVELDSVADKSLSILIIHQHDLQTFEKVKTRDFSDLETFYSAIREAREKLNFQK